MTAISTWFPYGWFHYLAGGVVIGLGIGVLFVLTGKVGGISTAFSAWCSWWDRHPHFQQARYLTSRSWRLVYALGLILGAALFTFTLGHGSIPEIRLPVWQLFLGGLIGGYGARLGNGCTSGHGICGLGNLSLPSLVAVLTFLATAILTALLVHALGGA